MPAKGKSNAYCIRRTWLCYLVVCPHCLAIIYLHVKQVSHMYMYMGGMPIGLRLVKEIDLQNFHVHVHVHVAIAI